MGVFDKILGVAFEMESPAAVVPPPLKPNLAPPMSGPGGAITISGTSLDNDRVISMVKKLKEVAYARNTAFKTILESMDKTKDIIPDEPTRLQVALATLTGEGRTPSSILQAIEIHLQDLSSEKTRFLTASNHNKLSEKSQMDLKMEECNRVSSKLTEDIKYLEQSILDKQSLLSQCIKNTAELVASRDTIEIEFEKVTQAFDYAFSTVNDDLLSKKAVFTSILNKGK